MKVITIKLAVFDKDADDIAARLAEHACTLNDAYLIRQSVMHPTQYEQKLMTDEHPELMMDDTVLHDGGNAGIKCYETRHKILVSGEPVSEDEAHNCDEMGCSTWEHILHKSDKDVLNYWRQRITPPHLKKRHRTAQKRKKSI